MTILHVVDFIALSFLIIALCEELRVLDGRKHPLIAAMWVGVTVGAFLCATYDIKGAPLNILSVVMDCLCTLIVWNWLRK